MKGEREATGMRDRQGGAYLVVFKAGGWLRLGEDRAGRERLLLWRMQDGRKRMRRARAGLDIVFIRVLICIGLVVAHLWFGSGRLAAV